ncbi:MAG TPA: flagellar basal body-associated FliL family protein [Patescibacteria group bacterium]|nr:flagellar basal body-associated FliL family protein [Patescibacteria group bacterium]
MAEDLEEDFEEGEGSDELSDAPPRRGGGDKKKLFLVVGLILLVVGSAAGVYFSGLADPLLHPAKSEPKKKEEDKPAEVQAAVFYDLPEILVNLNTAGRKQSFLKIRVSLELESALDVSKIEQVMPRIIDNFQVYLRELRVEDLQGSAGMLRLREELMMRVNNAVKPAKVNDVLFKEMLVQ